MFKPGSKGLDLRKGYILGLNNGVVVLYRLKFGDVVEKSRRELVNENLITFDDHWPSSTTKRYIFQYQCPETLRQFRIWFNNNLAKYIKIKGPKTIDYGFLQLEGLQIINNASNDGGDIQMNFTCLFEVAR